LINSSPYHRLVLGDDGGQGTGMSFAILRLSVAS
jgi:hypothetical protein